MKEERRIKNNDFLIKVMNGQKHLKHILTNEHIDKMLRVEARYSIARMPVCVSCERLGFWGKNKTCHCMHCGTITQNAIPLSEYYAAGYDLDGATGEDVSWVKHEKRARELIIPTDLKI